MIKKGRTKKRQRVYAPLTYLPDEKIGSGFIHKVYHPVTVAGTALGNVDLADALMSSTTFTLMANVYEQFKILRVTVEYKPVLPVQTDTATLSPPDYRAVMAYVPGTTAPGSYDTIYSRPGAKAFKTFESCRLSSPVIYQSGSTGMIPTNISTTVSSTTFCGYLVYKLFGDASLTQGIFHIKLDVAFKGKSLLIV